MEAIYRIIIELGDKPDNQAEYLKEASEIFNKITEDDMNNNCLKPHPILHEISEQASNDGVFELLKLAWNHDLFKKYWNSLRYIDEYGMTAIERLSVNHNVKNSPKKAAWIEKNMGIVFTKRFNVREKRMKEQAKLD